MKQCWAFLFIILFCKTIAAQGISEKEYSKHLKRIQQSKEKAEVIVSLDTIYNRGIAYALLRKVATADKDYSVKNLSGNELIYFRLNSFNDVTPTHNIGSVEKKYYYEMLFTPNKKRCETEFLSVAQLTNFLVKNNLVVNNDLNLLAADSLIAVKGNKFSEVQNKPLEIFQKQGEMKEFKLVERDKTKMIVIRNDEIEQDEKIIGRITIKKAEEGLIIYFLYTIQLLDGTTIASAKHQSLGSEDVEIKTMKDNKIIRITKPEYWIDKAIVQYLIDNGYL